MSKTGRLNANVRINFLCSIKIRAMFDLALTTCKRRRRVTKINLNHPPGTENVQHTCHDNPSCLNSSISHWSWVNVAV